MAGAFFVLAVFLVAALASSVLVGPSRRIAAAAGVLDQPGARKVHAVPTPRLGGIAVFVAFESIVAAAILLPPLSAGPRAVTSALGQPFAMLQEAHLVQGKLLALLAGGALAFGVGLLDDVLGSRFPFWLKALGQMLAAAILVAAGVRTSFMPQVWMNVALTLLWLVGITNAFNLLDNMDGLSAGVAFVASGVLLLNAWALGEFFISLILAAFMGSLLGFLRHNFNPATVFLGDCGSLFIGYVLASVTLLERYVSHASSTYFPVLMPVLVLAVPLLDTSTVMVIRIRERRPIYVGDRRHLSHRLVAMGFSPRAAVLLLYLLTFALGLGAANLSDATPGQSLLLLLQASSIVALVLVLMFHEPRAPDQDAG